uniref:Regulator of G protein signaling domain protein n=1 Tax=Syphacia muris TaxID=451379 RepID=A0A0N5A7S3_9BILA
MGTFDEYHRWSQKLENVLEDRNALEAFVNWMKTESSFAEHPIRLHFAIIAYRNMCAEHNSRTVELAKNLHQRYVSVNTGLCTFLPEDLRNEISARVHNLSTADPDPEVFDCLVPYLDNFLRKKHAQFVLSEEFLELYNQMMQSSAPTVVSTAYRSSTGFNLTSHGKLRKGFAHQPTLTAEMLLKTQFVRENTLGESEVEKLYPPSSKMPYVCNATTSKNDSAVSSTFSSEANNQNAALKLSTIREEQIRDNPATFTLARVEKLDWPTMYNHSTEEGRRFFATALIEKLNLLSAQRRRNDAMSQQLRNIESKKCSARDVIVNSVEPNVLEDDDDELDKYLREKMEDNSSKPSPSFYSPDSNNIHLSRFRRKSKWSSPDQNQYNVVTSAMDSLCINSGVWCSAGFMSLSQTKHIRNQNISGAKHYSKERCEASSSVTAADNCGSISICPTANIQCVDESHRAAAFQKARLLSSNSNRRFLHKHHDLSSQTLRSRNDCKPLLTISYRGKSRVPVVAHVPGTSITFREFRKTLGISSRNNMQFFFKCACEDGSAPYQMLLVNDDSTVLPIYEGKVTAECKTLSDSD